MDMTREELLALFNTQSAESKRFFEVTREELLVLFHAQSVESKRFFDSQSDEFKKLIEQQSEQLKAAIETVAKNVESLVKDVSAIKTNLDELNSRVERQDRRLSAIESFPMPPVKQPNRLYASEPRSMCLSQYVKLGYAG